MEIVELFAGILGGVGLILAGAGVAAYIKYARFKNASAELRDAWRAEDAAIYANKVGSQR